MLKFQPGQQATIRNATVDGVESSVEKPLSDNEKSVLNIIKNNPTFSAQTISKNPGIPFRTVQRALKSLRDKEVIHHAGPTKGGRWGIL